MPREEDDQEVSPRLFRARACRLRKKEDHMPRFQISHPHEEGLVATYGWDRALGFFVDVPASHGPLRRRRGEYDALQPCYDHRRPLQGALHFLANQMFFTLGQLQETLSALQQDFAPEEMGDDLRACAKAVSNLKKAAEK